MRTTEGSRQELSSVSRLQLTSTSLVIVGLSTETMLPDTDLPRFVPTVGVGSATSDELHQIPRAFSVSSPSNARRTYALVLFEML